MRAMIIRCALLIATFTVGLASSAEPQWRITSADQKSSIAIGVLAQIQFESLTAANESDAAVNLYVRRLRLIFGGKVTEKVSFFIETDSPNIGKANAAGVKSADAMFVQDAVVTFAARSTINLEGGLIIVPTSRHTTQSAATLIGVDYGAFAFSHSDATHSRVGRDYGIQARGYLANKHLEFRTGVFAGARGTGASAPLRYAARAVWYPFEADTGIFYQGTSLGAKKVVGIGAGIDHQDDYTASSFDAYVDHPIAEGRQSVTAQVNYVRYDGGSTFAQLPKQDVWLVEAAWYHKGAKVGPFVQWTSKDVSQAGVADESKVTGGLCYFAEGHRFNLKAGLAQVTKTSVKNRTQFVVQGQLFMF